MTHPPPPSLASPPCARSAARSGSAARWVRRSLRLSWRDPPGGKRQCARRVSLPARRSSAGCAPHGSSDPTGPRLTAAECDARGQCPTSALPAGKVRSRLGPSGGIGPQGPLRLPGATWTWNAKKRASTVRWLHEFTAGGFVLRTADERPLATRRCSTARGGAWAGSPWQKTEVSGLGYGYTPDSRSRPRGQHGWIMEHSDELAEENTAAAQGSTWRADS